MSHPARRLLLFVFLVGSGGLFAELLLLNHVESATQFVPLVLTAVASLALAIAAVAPSNSAVWTSRAVMALMILSGALGMYLHVKANTEFQLDIDPTLSGAALFWKAIRAKAPPALAPGAMVQLGLIGLAYSYRHPALGASSRYE
jgi:hypothetical protein